MLQYECGEQYTFSRPNDVTITALGFSGMPGRGQRSVRDGLMLAHNLPHASYSSS